MYPCERLIKCGVLLSLAIVPLVGVRGAALEYNSQNPQKSDEPNLPVVGAHNEVIAWVQEMKLLRQYTKDCIGKTSDTTWNCFKESSARILDDILSSSVIPVWPGVRLVRMPVQSNATNENRSKSFSEFYDRKDLQHLTWFDRLAMRLAHTLSTHFLQVNLKELTDAYMRALERDENNNRLAAEEPGTARHRRQRYNMMITMMFGVTALGAVLVPMGFQMLSIVSGKALLLAKMALLLASINGLKKFSHSFNPQVANSGIHYGLYHVPGEHYGYYDRGDAPHHPRQVASFTVAQPVTEELGLKK
ncbi:PREDICTED: uncharacterized protein LOC108377485 [Rhagoletis zephyria]|uniref:uncharacterized protein LOC108377485 n=1 Tax=Rhagoletis zephyria TaxID=28612 RepID=UPI00081157F3|nr:PREDICTED: uncharacterized protein LOC108377485 [Rhagoletis zephyria]